MNYSRQWLVACAYCVGSTQFECNTIVLLVIIGVIITTSFYSIVFRYNSLPLFFRLLVLAFSTIGCRLCGDVMVTCCACVRLHIFAVKATSRSYTIVTHRDVTTRRVHASAMPKKRCAQRPTRVDTRQHVCVPNINHTNSELMLECSGEKRELWYLCRILELTQVQFHQYTFYIRLSTWALCNHSVQMKRADLKLERTDDTQ